jgi:ribosome-binding factor A
MATFAKYLKHSVSTLSNKIKIRLNPSIFDMESKRQKQVAELIKRNFSIVLQEESPNICGFSILVTVTNVIVSPDMSSAKIYLSIFNTDHKQEPIMLLNEELVLLRSKLGHRIRKLVRIIPTISLYDDDTIDEMYRIDDMMKKLDAEGQFGTKEEE